MLQRVVKGGLTLFLVAWIALAMWMHVPPRSSPTPPCKGNLRNLGTALEMYASDNDGRYPSALDRLVPNFITRLPTCPTAQADTYRLVTSASARAYTILCEGTWHEESGMQPNFPQYSSAKGLADGAHERISGLAISPDGRCLAIAGRTQTVLFDLDSGAPRAGLETGAGLTVLFSDDSQTLVTLGDGRVRRWNVATGSLRGMLDAPAASAFAMGGSVVAVQEVSAVSLWDLHSGAEKRRLPVRGPSSCVAVSRDGSRVAALGDPVLVWDVGSGQVVHQSTGYGEAGAFTPDGGSLVLERRTSRVIDDRASERSSSLLVIDLGTGKERPLGAAATPFRLSPDGAAIAFIGNQNRARLYSLGTGPASDALAEQATSLAFSADGRHLAIGSLDARVTIVEVATRQTRTVLTASEPVSIVAWGPGSHLVLCGLAQGTSGGRTAQVWDVEKQQLLYQLQLP